VFLLTFDSTHDAMAAQKELAGFDPLMIPTPRSLSAGCGMALKLLCENAEPIREALRRSSLSEGSFKLYRQNAHDWQMLSG